MDVTGSNALNNQIILANTYHLALQPGTELVRDVGTAIRGEVVGKGDEGGLHEFMGWDRNILTDSGGFQMVSLLKLAEITEEGVTFENPFLDRGEEIGICERDGQEQAYPDETVKNNKKRSAGQSLSAPTINNNTSQYDYTDKNNEQLQQSDHQYPKTKSQRMLLRPEDSIYHQNNIGSDIIMALDDVVSSTADDRIRFEIATYRTLRWLDRCHAAHRRPHDQNLFPIVQGGLDTSPGGLRDICLAGFRLRDEKAPGYAIGGLAGGESKDDFWRVVHHCCCALPDTKPRYLMGVGYPLDLVVCTALGVDMYDCVYPTRTARFGVALVDGETPGTLRLKSHHCAEDYRVIMKGCGCVACSDGNGDGDGGGYTRARLHAMLKNDNPLAVSLVTHHNLAYMMELTRRMREAIKKDAYGDFARSFVRDQFRGKDNGGQDVPTWVKDALAAAGIPLDK